MISLESRFVRVRRSNQQTSAIQGIYDSFDAATINSYWKTFSIPSANGTLSASGGRLQGAATAAPWQAGVASPITFDSTHVFSHLGIADNTALTKRISISPSFVLGDPFTANLDCYFIQTFSGANVAAFRNKGGVLTSLGSSGTSGATLDFFLLIVNGAIYFSVNTGSFASDTYQIKPGPIYLYATIVVGGAVPPLTASLDDLMIISNPLGGFE